MIKKGVWGKGWMWFFLSVTWLWANPVNIAPDAVTRATQGYNNYEGELSYLTDGLYPDNSDQPGIFSWSSKGNLIFQFEEPRQVASLRLCIGGDAGSYVAIAYLGVRFGESGQTETGDGGMVADAYNMDFQSDTWVELAFPQETWTDYIELITESGAQIYEIEILIPGTEPTAVPQASWGWVKRLK